MINLYRPELILITKEALDYQYTKNILDKLPNIPYEIGNFEYFFNKYKDCSINKGKKILLLDIQKGKFIQNCPGTNDHICCGYKVINFAFNCHFNCTYCFLQFYQNMPFLVFYVNIGKLEEELYNLSLENKIYRIGTGEFADSLAIDNIFEYSKIIYKFAEKFPNLIFEMKTKSALVDFYKNSEKVLKNVILAWTINTEKIIDEEEYGTADYNERFEAIKEVYEKGYNLAFHFDPIIIYDNYLEDYKKAINRIFSIVKNTEKIFWISLGGFRYEKRLKQIIQERFSKSKIIYGDTIIGNDGKIRYFSRIRKLFFKKLYDYIKSYDNNLLVYLCMETEYQWKFLNDEIKSSDDLTSYLDKVKNKI